MRGSKARRLRNLAFEQSVGLPLIRYHVGRPPSFVPNLVPMLVGGTMTNVPMGFNKSGPGVPTSMSLCTRRIYKDLKRGRKTEGVRS